MSTRMPHKQSEREIYRHYNVTVTIRQRRTVSVMQTANELLRGSPKHMQFMKPFLVKTYLCNRFYQELKDFT